MQGHSVTLLDGELAPLTDSEIVQQVTQHFPEVILIGHSGSTSAHPIIVRLTRLFRITLPSVATRSTRNSFANSSQSSN